MTGPVIRPKDPMQIYKEFDFEAAHHLPRVAEGHKCARLHGHSFHLRITVQGPVHPDSGWVADFATITEAFEPLWRDLDHRYLNEIEGLENPTSENIARWIWVRLAARLPGLFEVEIRETCNSGCIYRGESH